ncbi:MAG: EscU/YscU/HrcU family type III secretion system export apparatus switch protein, partial [Planctomycetales bacterium]|nr:EscU/YscU/HrcU family type III secretion system export apparatus switch protein [Planctomycetales bacterium]
AFVAGIIYICLPLVTVAGLVGIGTTFLQVGPSVSTEALNMDWSKLSPAKGMSRLFSMRSAIRAIMMILKMSASVVVLMWVLSSYWGEIRQLGILALPSSLSAAWNISLSIVITLAGAYLVIGGFDYTYQRVQHEQDLKMTRQEIREEQKEQEVDANLRARIRRIQREWAKQTMLRQVPTASVVLTNPTHYAVALRYDRSSKSAPIVVAKGTDALARRIIKIAKENGVTVLERKPLARALYAMVEVNQEIPPQLYKAIAEILAFVLGLRRRKR